MTLLSHSAIDGSKVSAASGRQQWHLITPEYPPKIGGVSDYTFLVAAGLAQAADDVHVWCPTFLGGTPATSDVTVHRELGEISIADLARVGRLLNRFPAPRRILLQWVPHGYGHRSLNLPFCCWLWGRSAIHGDWIEIMVHEPFLAFREGSWRQDAAALVHRLMTIILVQAAQYVWTSVPSWEGCWRPYALGRRIPFRWLPVPANIPVVEDTAGVQAVRLRYAVSEGLLVGHFGTYGASTTSLLERALLALADEPDGCTVMLMGKGSDGFRERLLRKHPRLTERIHATATLTVEALSRHIGACDLLIQPYVDGVTARNGSIMAGLSHGKPVITTSGKWTEPFWKEGKAVALAPAEDTGELVRLVRQLISEPEERSRMGQAARKLYRERFDIAHTVQALRGER